jgi:mRNA-degrading endonuclease toxin of MazEF toxin-antitoxin module
MARGDVLALRRGIGFGTRETLERFVVVQNDVLTDALETVLAVPLDEQRPEYQGYALALPVTARECGTPRPHVALATQLSCVRLDRFEPDPVGKLKRATLDRLSKALQLVMDLPTS